MPKMKTIKLALDWHPTPLHLGLLMAVKHDFTHIELINPEADALGPLPLKKLLQAEVQMAIVSPEAIIMHPDKLVALAALQQPGASAWLLRAGALGTQAVRYGYYHLPLEQKILRLVVHRQQWEASVELEDNLSHQDLWKAFTHAHIDLLWIFKYWEGVLFTSQNLVNGIFIELSDLQIPYPYTPVLAVNRQFMVKEQHFLHQFLRRAASYYEHFSRHTAEAISWFTTNVDNIHKYPHSVWEQSMQAAAHYWLDENGRWGKMQAPAWQQYIQWLHSNGLINHANRLQVSSLIDMGW